MCEFWARGAMVAQCAKNTSVTGSNPVESTHQNHLARGDFWLLDLVNSTFKKSFISK